MNSKYIIIKIFNYIIIITYFNAKKNLENILRKEKIVCRFLKHYPGCKEWDIRQVFKLHVNLQYIRNNINSFDTFTNVSGIHKFLLNSTGFYDRIKLGSADFNEIVIGIN